MTNEAVPCSRCSSDIYCEMNGCQRLASAAAPAAQPELVESVAKSIYEQWAVIPGYVAWVDGGNSLNQDRARSIARTAISAAPAARPATPLREVLSDEPDPETRGYLRGHREMSDYHTAAMKDAYGLLGIDGSDGEYRYKWVALEISNLKAALLAASSDEDRKLMEQAREALANLVARIEANGGIGDYTKGPAFVMQGAYDAIAALRSRLDGEKT